MIEKDVKAALSTLCGGRVYPVLLPQSPTYPAITYMCVGVDADYSMGGLSSKPVERRQIQIDIWGETYDAAKGIAYAAHGIMAASTGFMAILENETDGYEPEVEIFHVTQEYACWQATT